MSGNEKDQKTFFYGGQASLLSPEGNALMEVSNLKLSFDLLSDQPSAPLVLAKYPSGERRWLALNCVFYQGIRWDFNSPVEGCVFILPFKDDWRLLDQRGGALILPPKVAQSVWVKIYLFGETDPRFSQIYNDGLNLELVNGKLKGPIKVWEYKAA